MNSRTPCARPTRRNRSRQRERLLKLLRSTDSHPSAAWLHASLRKNFPHLSLGTVYRNLDVLLEEGEIVEIPDTGGLRRFDGNTSTHHHFECEHCGSILDVELPLARGLRILLEQRHGLVARQIRMHCQGLCPDCATESHA